MKNDEEYREEAAGGAGATAEDAEELSTLVRDLLGLMISVKIEAENPPRGTAVRAAERIRAELGQPNSRIQDAGNGVDAVLGPLGGDADAPGPALRSATAALGGDWGDVGVTTTDAGPVHHVARAAGQTPGGADAVGIRLWAASAWALVRYAEEHS
ncbi:hypothetical protein ACQPZG_03205 (plasmid) [Streptomyces sp. CA-294286]|uniref:hypothetical protein n=1 Tax=Streptomyces sp. CA-294286 TaxID=3240070 RepID=UPI003D8E94C5